MELFNDECVHITAIHSVKKHASTEHSVGRRLSYGTNLFAYELIFYISGSNDTVFGGVEMKDEKNSLRFLPKGYTPGEYTVNCREAGYCIDIFFDCSDELPTTALSYKGMEDLREKFIKIYNVWEQHKPDYYVNAMMLFYDIIRSIKNHQSDYLSTQHKSILEKAHDYIVQNYRSCSFDYSELCKTTGLSYSYFYDLFKKRYKMSPSRYVTKMKLDYARELLITGHYSIGEIADLCGFENVYYFSNVFKKELGVSPSKYKPHYKKQ